MIIKFTVPVSIHETNITQFKKNTDLLFSLTHCSLEILEINFSDNCYAGISITTNSKKTVLFDFFCPINELPYPELNNYFLRLIKIASNFTANYIVALTALDLATASTFKKIDILLNFLESQVKLQGF